MYAVAYGVSALLSNCFVRMPWQIQPEAEVGAAWRVSTADEFAQLLRHLQEGDGSEAVWLVWQHPLQSPHGHPPRPAVVLLLPYIYPQAVLWPTAGQEGQACTVILDESK